MAPGGYAWWYLDALSADGAHGLVAIAFVGSVFSPYYARARRRAGPGGADPQSHCALNVSLYRGSRRMWTMTERGAGAVQRDAAQLQIGPSALRWAGDHLELRIDEVTAPWPQRVRGTVRLWPQALQPAPLALDAAGRHRWWPIAPMAEVEVALDAPALHWRGRGYLDSNRGDEPLERGFHHWHWARAHRRDGSGLVIYDARRADGTAGAMALHFPPHGPAQRFEAPAEAALPRGAWGIARGIRCDAGQSPAIVHKHENGPFYTRSLVRTHWLGEPVLAMHESLSLDRFAQPWVQAMLPFRMPRRG